MASNQLILITGASGFVATHNVSDFLKQGYRVRATVRSDKTASNVAKIFPEYKEQLSFAIVDDITKEGVFDEAVKGVDGVIHTASPFTTAVEDNERDLLNPAIKGTTNVLKAVKAHAPQVRRVVITSSFVAILDLMKGGRPGHTYTEADWNPVTYEDAKAGDGGVAYCASKKLAEEAAWNFVKTETPNFDLATICPPLVFGPVMQHLENWSRLNTSSLEFYKLMDGTSYDAVPDTMFFAFADVRDVALAHLRAYERPEAAGQRYLITNGYYTWQGMVEVLRAELPEIKGVPGKDAGPAPEVYAVDTSKARRQLGIEFRSLTETTVDTAKSLLQVQESLAEQL